MKLNRNKKNLLKKLRKKLVQKKSWFILSFYYPEKVRESYLSLHQSIREHQDDLKKINGKI